MARKRLKKVHLLHPHSYLYLVASTVMIVLLITAIIAFSDQNTILLPGSPSKTDKPIDHPMLYPGYQWQEVQRGNQVLANQALFRDDEERIPVTGIEWITILEEPADPITPIYLGVVDYYSRLLESQKWQRTAYFNGATYRPLSIANSYEKAEGFVRMKDANTLEVIILYTRNEALPGTSVQTNQREIRIFVSDPLPVDQL